MPTLAICGSVKPAAGTNRWAGVTDESGCRDAVYTSVLYFRTAEEITTDLERAGFRDVIVRCGWRDEPPADDSASLVFKAHKR